MARRKNTKAKSSQKTDNASSINQKKFEQDNTSKLPKKKNSQMPDQQAEEEKSNEVVWKKNPTKYSDKIFRNNYMKLFIKKGSTDYHGECIYCNRDILVDNLYDHIKSGKHRNKTDKKEHDDLDGLIKDINDYGNLKKTKKELKKEKELKGNQNDIYNYLEFLAFGMAERFSFSQISKIGLFIKNIIKDNKAGFFKNQSFDEEEISLIARNCFQKSLIEDINKKLESRPFSLIIDNSTISKENYCVLQARFLESINNETVVTNKVLKIHKLDEKSDAKTMHKIIKDRLLSNPEIERNFIGIVHDNASSLIGKYNGLVTKLQEDKSNLFSLKDPCHCFNLILKNSLSELPKRIMKFVTKIHLHFKWPQRKAILSNIQKEIDQKELTLKPYIKTKVIKSGH